MSLKPSSRIVRHLALLLALSGPCVAGADTSAQIPPSLRSAMERTMYRIDPVKGTGGAAASRATNQAHRLNVSFTSSGVSITSGAVSGASWLWVMDLKSWGYRGSTSPVSPANLSVFENRIEYRRGPLTEWYVNGRTGLEQGFTIIAPPGGTRSSRQILELDLAVHGDLAPRLKDSASAIQLVARDGTPVLSYSELHAFDAAGRSLPARLAVGFRRIKLLVNDTAATYPITVDPVIWSEQATLTVDDVDPIDQFGASVALSGDTAVIGSPFRNTGTGFNDLAAGEVYVFFRSGGAWSLQQALIAADGLRNALFGYSVAVAGDTLVIGAPGHNNFTGKAYVYVRSGSNWSLQQSLVNLGGTFNDELGISVALSGETVLAGASRPAFGSGFGAGKVHVFVRSGETWSLQQTLALSDGLPGDQFGFSVDLRGETALIGAPRRTQFAPSYIQNAGQAYVFVRSDGTWSLQQTLTDPESTASGLFGYSVALNSDTALVGAPGRAAVAVFVRDASAWTFQQDLTASDGAAGDEFGIPIALNGNTALVGAPRHSTTPDFPGFLAGQAYVFVRGGSTWSLQQTLTPSDATAHSSFGFAVALSGASALISAPFHHLTNGSPIVIRGQAYVFVKSGTVLTALGPAKVWVGLANSDAVGLRLDLLAEVLVNDAKVGQGQLNNVSSGSSGFNNALFQAIDLGLTGGSVTVNHGDTLELRVSARRTCFGGGHNSGAVRLWYNGQPIDAGTGRDAGTRFDATISGATNDYFARNGFALDLTAGSSKLFIDETVGSGAPCPNRPFSSFGTWSVGLP